MDRTALGGQPDQQGRLQDQAAELDQSTLEEFDSVLDEAALASPNSPAGDSAVRSADQDPSSDEYSELLEDSVSQLGALGAAPDADAGAPAGGVQQAEPASQQYQLGHLPEEAFSQRLEGSASAIESVQPVISQQKLADTETVIPPQHLQHQQSAQPPSAVSQTELQLDAMSASLQSMMTALTQMPQTMAAIAREVVAEVLKPPPDLRCSAEMPAQERGGGSQQPSQDQSYDGKRGGMPDQLPGTALPTWSAPPNRSASIATAEGGRGPDQLAAATADQQLQQQLQQQQPVPVQPPESAESQTELQLGESVSANNLFASHVAAPLIGTDAQVGTTDHLHHITASASPTSSPVQPPLLSEGETADSERASPYGSGVGLLSSSKAELAAEADAAHQPNLSSGRTRGVPPDHSSGAMVAPGLQREGTAEKGDLRASARSMSGSGSRLLDELPDQVTGGDESGSHKQVDVGETTSRVTVHVSDSRPAGYLSAKLNDAVSESQSLLFLTARGSRVEEPEWHAIVTGDEDFADSIDELEPIDLGSEKVTEEDVLSVVRSLVPMADEPLIFPLTTADQRPVWWVAIDSYGAAGRSFAAITSDDGLQCVPMAELVANQWEALAPPDMEGLCGLLDQADSEIARQLMAQCSRTQHGFSVSAPHSKVPSEVKHVELEQGFLACGINFLPLANVLAPVRQKWRRLAYKLWLMKTVGLGLIPALTHVGGRDLGDYVSGPDDFVGLVAEHFASAWTLRDVVSSLDSTFQLEMDGADPEVTMARLKSAKIQWSRAKYDTISSAEVRDLSGRELRTTLQSCFSSMMDIIADDPTPAEVSRRRQPTRQCKGKHQVSPGGNWYGGVSRFEDRSSVVKAIAGSLTMGERGEIAQEHSFGVDSDASCNQGVVFVHLKDGFARMIAQFGMPIRLFEVSDAHAVSPWATVSRLQDPDQARCVICYQRGRVVSTNPMGIQTFELPVQCLGCQFYVHSACSHGSISLNRLCGHCDVLCGPELAYNHWYQQIGRLAPQLKRPAPLSGDEAWDQPSHITVGVLVGVASVTAEFQAMLKTASDTFLAATARVSLASLQSDQTVTGRISGRRARLMAQRLVRQQLGIDVATGTSQLLALSPDGRDQRQEAGWGDLLYPFTDDRGHVSGLLYFVALSAEDAHYAEAMAADGDVSDVWTVVSNPTSLLGAHLTSLWRSDACVPLWDGTVAALEQARFPLQETLLYALIESHMARAAVPATVTNTPEPAPASEGGDGMAPVDVDVTLDAMESDLILSDSAEELDSEEPRAPDQFSCWPYDGTSRQLTTSQLDSQSTLFTRRQDLASAPKLLFPDTDGVWHVGVVGWRDQRIDAATPVDYDPFICDDSQAYYVLELIRDAQGARRLWCVGAQRLFPYRRCDRGCWGSSAVPVSVSQKYGARLQSLQEADGVSYVGGAAHVPSPASAGETSPAGGESTYDASPQKHVGSTPEKQERDGSTLTLPARDSARANSTPGQMASPVFSNRGSPGAPDQDWMLSAISALQSSQSANKTTVVNDRFGRELDRSVIVQSQEQSFGHMTLMSPAEYAQLPKDLDGVVKPEDYAKAELEETLLHCMKPGSAQVIKLKTPESQVKLMLGRIPKRKSFENVADWIRNEFNPVLKLVTAPYCCIETILASFLTLVGGKFKESWQQVYNRRLKAANNPSAAKNTSRSDVVQLIGGQVLDMFRDAQGVLKLPSFGHYNYILAECMLHCVRNDATLKDSKRRHLEYMFRSSTTIKQELLMQITKNGYELESWRHWEDRWHEEFAQQESRGQFAVDTPIRKAVKLLYSVPMQLVDEVWRSIGDAGMEIPSNQNETRMFELLRNAYSKVRVLHVKYEPSIGYNWHKSKQNDGKDAAKKGDNSDSSGGKGKGGKGKKGKGKGGGRGKNDDGNHLNASESDEKTDSDSNELNATILRTLANDDATCFATMYDKQNNGSKQSKDRAIKSMGGKLPATKWKQPATYEMPDNLPAGDWTNNSCLPCLKTKESAIVCTDADCISQCNAFLRLNPGFNQNGLHVFNHNCTACPFIIARETKLDKQPMVKDVAHAAYIIRRLHGSQLRQFPFGKDSPHNDLRSPDVRSKLRKEQRAQGLLAEATSSSK